MTADETDALPLIRCMVLQAARDGELALEGLTSREIRHDVVALLRGYAHSSRSPWVLKVEIDHLESLSRAGGSFSDEGQPELAVIVFTTAVEHWVNGMLSVGVKRKGRRLSSKAKEASMRNKLTVSWPEYFDTTFPEHLLRELAELADARNKSVHYKWPSRSEEETERNRARMVVIANRAPDLLARLRDLEDHVVFANRLKDLESVLDELGLPSN